MSLEEVFRQFGLYSAFTLPVALLMRRLVATWLDRRVEAQVEEGLQKRVATHQLDLDKDLERHRSALAQDAESLRAALAKVTIDYGLYAAKRHEAQAKLFEEFLGAELLATDHSSLRVPDPESVAEGVVASWLHDREASPERTEECLALFRNKRWGELRRDLDRIVEDSIRTRVIAGRNAAYEAYNRHALYLPEAVDYAAVAVRDQFHTVVVPYVLSPGNASGVEMHANKLRLRVLMLDFLHAARADLGRAATSLSPRSLPEASGG